MPSRIFPGERDSNQSGGTEEAGPGRKLMPFRPPWRPSRNVLATFFSSSELMLRSQPLKLGKTRLQGSDVKLAPEREMVELVL